MQSCAADLVVHGCGAVHSDQVECADERIPNASNKRSRLAYPVGWSWIAEFDQEDESLLATGVPRGSSWGVEPGEVASCGRVNCSLGSGPWGSSFVDFFLVHPTEALQTQAVTPQAAAPQDFLRHRSGVQWDSRKRPLVTKAIRGLTRHWRTGAWISLVRLRCAQSPTPFLQAAPVYPR